MNIGDRITTLRKQKGMSQNDLGQAVGVSREIVGRYERNEVVPSVEVAKRVADVFGVSLDNLVGEGLNSNFDRQTVRRIQDIEELDKDSKFVLFNLIDTYIRDAKTRRAHAG